MKSAFSETLSNLRREKKLSQRQAAARLGVSQALLSHYENDVREPKLEFVIKACDYYGVTADYLLGRNDERNGVSLNAIEDMRDVIGKLIKLKTNEGNLISKLKQLTSQ